MSPNLGFGLFDRSISHFSLARQISAPISPQDIGHTFVAANLANNGCFVKRANGRHLTFSAVHLPATLVPSYSWVALMVGRESMLDSRMSVSNPLTSPCANVGVGT